VTAQPRPLGIARESAAFLVEMFTGLRDDLQQQVQAGGKASPDPGKAARDLAVYEALLASLAGREAFPEDEGVRQYVADLMRATDEENGYEQAALEHRAFAELAATLGM
jgi:hypothetical protein